MSSSPSDAAARRPLHALARLTRCHHPKGTDRLLRLVHPPGNPNPVQTVVDYDDGLLLHVDTSSFCEWYIFFYGVFRPEISKLLNRMLRPGQVAIDIGANIGMHSVVMGNRVGPTGRVISFEPDPHPFARLNQNLRLNRMNWVETQPKALSSRAGRTTFFLHDETIGNYANASLHAANIGKPSASVEVEIVTLDEVTRDLPRLDVIKLLAQGEEWNILQGAQATIEKHRPTIFFLYEPAYWQRQGKSLADAHAFFGRHGYTVHAVEFGPRRIVTGEIDKGQVLLATP